MRKLPSQSSQFQPLFCQFFGGGGGNGIRQSGFTAELQQLCNAGFLFYAVLCNILGNQFPPAVTYFEIVKVFSVKLPEVRLGVGGTAASDMQGGFF